MGDTDGQATAAAAPMSGAATGKVAAAATAAATAVAADSQAAAAPAAPASTSSPPPSGHTAGSPAVTTIPPPAGSVSVQEPAPASAAPTPPAATADGSTATSGSRKRRRGTRGGKKHKPRAAADQADAGDAAPGHENVAAPVPPPKPTPAPAPAPGPVSAAPAASAAVPTITTPSGSVAGLSSTPSHPASSSSSSTPAGPPPPAKAPTPVGLSSSSPLPSSSSSAAPIVVMDITKDNLTEAMPALLRSLGSADFVAVDLEMSGIGSGINHPDLPQRYAHLRESATTRAVLSLGLAIFAPPAADAERSVGVHVFNIVMRCEQPYVVEPGALQFLTDHGFDFNLQIAKGVSYHPGDDAAAGGAAPAPAPGADSSKHAQEEKKGKGKGKGKGHKDKDGGASPPNPQPTDPLRLLFAELLAARKPLVLHNGLIDLVFLYQALYAQLPPTLDEFVADLTAMFPAGVYDTKFAAEFELRKGGSFLELLFRKCQRLLGAKQALPLRFAFAKLLTRSRLAPSLSHVPMPALRPAPVRRANGGQRPPDICIKYASFGHCPRGMSCHLSHDLDRILDEFEAEAGAGGRKPNNDSSSSNGRKRKHQEEQEEEDGWGRLQEAGKAAADVEGRSGSELRTGRSQGHRAGFDAFMTGYCFAALNRLLQPPPLTSTKNKIYLLGKPRPLLILKSQYAGYSQGHMDKVKRAQQAQGGGV